MKNILFILLVYSFNTFSQIGTNPIYVPGPITPPNPQSNYYYSENYIYSQLDLVIKDENYYKRQDKIAQQAFKDNLAIVKKTYEYYMKSDWQSAIYYGKDIRYTEYYEISNLKHFIITTSYFYLGDVKNSKKWYSISSKNVDPETMRSIDDAINKSGMSEKIKHEEADKIKKKHDKNKGALIGGIIATIMVPVTIITTLIVLNRQ
jgi:hypothetical protein